MKRSAMTVWKLGTLAIGLLVSNSLQVQPVRADQITTCVEPAANVANNISRKQRSTRSDCDPDKALQRARDQARINARNVISPLCIDRITPQEAEATCRSHGLSLPTSATQLGRPPIPAAGRPRIDASLPIQSSGPKLCTVLRDVNNETETNTESDAICFLNNFRRTIVRARSRAFCAVECF